MNIVQALEDPNILLKAVTKTIKNETKKQKRRFSSMLIGTLGAIRKLCYKKEKGTVRAGPAKQWDF